MQCFECVQAGRETPAVALCRQCGAGLCVEHVAINERYAAGGLQIGCLHDLSQGLGSIPTRKGVHDD